MLDVDALSEMMAGIISEEVEKAVAPLHARLAELESRPVGSQMDDIKGVVEVMISDALVTRSVNQSTVEKLIADEIAKIEPAKELDREELANLVNDAVAALPPAQDGKSVEIEDVLPAIAAEVAKAVEQLPSPKDGIDGKDGADGSGIADLLRDHEGNLVASFTDGRLKNLGPIQGKDGKDGRDGFGLEDFDVRVLEDDRTIEFAFKAGEHENIATLKWPTVIYRGVFKDGEQYERGDMATWAGSLWHCDEPTKDKPGTDAWTLAAKKGRDGKDAKNG